MTTLQFIHDLFGMLLVFALAIFVGFQTISKVPTTLHTPLMSATNAIHGVVIVGAIFVVATVFNAGLNQNMLMTALAAAAVFLGTINVVGGFAVTERMLEMFKKKDPVKK